MGDADGPSGGMGLGGVVGNTSADGLTAGVGGLIISNLLTVL